MKRDPRKPWTPRIMTRHKDKDIHVYPIFENEPTHELSGTSCWCEPRRDWECDNLIIHSVSQ